MPSVVMAVTASVANGNGSDANIPSSLPAIPATPVTASCLLGQSALFLGSLRTRTSASMSNFLRTAYALPPCDGSAKGRGGRGLHLMTPYCVAIAPVAAAAAREGSPLWPAGDTAIPPARVTLLNEALIMKVEYT